LLGLQNSEIKNRQMQSHDLEEVKEEESQDDFSFNSDIISLLSS